MPSRHVSGDVPQCTWATVTRMVGTVADQSLTETFPPMMGAKTIGGTKIYPDIDGINNYMDWTGGPTGLLTASFDDFDPSNPVTGITIPAATPREHEYRIDFTIDAVDAGALTARAIAYNDDHSSYEILSEMDVSASSDYSLNFTSTTDTTWLMVEGMNMQGGQSFRVTKAVMQKYVYVPVTVFTQICDQGDDYRFGFNGQEKTNEIAGVGNQNTAMFWEYDTRLGRRWNLDPVDQISVSNYSAFKNNPILFSDLHGNNAVVEKSGNTITVTAKIYYQGKDLPSDPEEQRQYIADINNKLKELYKETKVKGDDGAEYTIKYNITASVDMSKKRENLGADENIMTVDNDLAKVDGVSRSFVDSKPPKEPNQGYVTSSADQWNGSPSTNSHEIGHMLGLADRYTVYNPSPMAKAANKPQIVLPHEGYQGSLMANYPEHGTLLLLQNKNFVKFAIQSIDAIKIRSPRYLGPQPTSFKINSIWDAANSSAPNKEEENKLLKSGYNIGK